MQFRHSQQSPGPLTGQRGIKYDSEDCGKHGGRHGSRGLMIAITELRKTVREHPRLVGILHTNRAYGGAVYHCGYAVEIALKSRVCRTLRWTEFPSTGKDFQNFKSLQTHNLETLLRFSGVEGRVTLTLDAEWSQVKEWNPEQRYDPVGTQTAAS